MPAGPAERIARFLAERARRAGPGLAPGAPAAEIAAAVLSLTGLPGPGAEAVVRGLIGRDPRFLCEDGLWRLASPRVAAEEGGGALEPTWVAESGPAWDPADEDSPGPGKPRRARVRAASPSPAGTAGASAPSPPDAGPVSAHAARLLPAPLRVRLPAAPGVYVFRARNGRPLYVGKAKDLRRRILSHFRGAAAAREAELHEATASVTFEVLGSEAEALLREFELIARHAPRHNLQRGVGRRRGAVRGGRVVVLPATSPGRVRLYGLREDGSVVVREIERSRRLAVSCAAFAARYLRPPPRRAQGALAPERAEADRARTAILFGWLARHRDRVTEIDPRRAAGPDDLARLLRAHVADADLFFEPHRHV